MSLWSIRTAGLPDQQSDARMPLFAVALATAVLVLGFDFLDGRYYYHDIDDTLRAIQIRQLLAHGNWFDLTVAGIDMPGSYVSPWSRLVDLPYVLLTFCLQTIMPQPDALKLAFRIWPPVLLVFYCGLWVSTAVRLAASDRRIEPLHVVAAFALMPLTLWEFVPGRVDHHNLQIVMLIMALNGISRWSAIGGFVAGVACGLSFVIGLELAPVLLIILVAPGCAWILGIASSRRVQLSFSGGLALATIGSGLLLIGPSRMTATECDAFSAPYVTILLGYAFLTAGTVWWVRSTRPGINLAVLAVAGATLSLSFALAFPACLQGPYATIDPLVRSLWLDRIQQEKSFLDFYMVGEPIKIVSLGLLIVALLGALPIAMRRIRERDAAFVTIFGVAATLMLLTLVQTRFIRFPAVAVLLFLPLVWSEVKAGVPSTLRATAIAVPVILAAGTGLLFAVPAIPFRPTLLDYTSLDLCVDVDTRPLANLPPGRILAPSSLGLFMIDGLPPGFTVSSVSFHRAAPGMRRMYDALISTDSATRRNAVTPYDYIAVCRFEMVPEIPDDTLFAVLTRGGEWPGLVPLVDGPAGSLRLLRIDHSAFH